MRVLQIGQLPKEMGGNYTTGVARVVGELSKHKFGQHEVFLYGTNISEEKAHLLCNYKNQYMGYVKRPLHLICHILLHLISSIKAYKTYKVTDNASFLHMEFIRDNLSRVIDEVKPDVIHHHGTALSSLYYANKKKNIPIIYSPHGFMWVNEEGGDASYEQRLKATTLSLTFANHYTALNESVVKRMQKLGVERDKITIIPNGVDTKKFYYSESARNELRKKFDVNDSTLVFITVGLVIDRKGQMSFLKMLESLDIDYQYWIIGKGPDEELIHQYAEERKIQDKVKLLGYVEDKEIYKYHSAADFYALGSSEEAQSLAEIEAYTCGLRTIVNHVISETVIGDVSKETDRYYVVDFDAVDKVDLIIWLGRAFMQRVSVWKYDWSEIALKYADYYNMVSENS